jgi:hypothetical protein
MLIICIVAYLLFLWFLYPIAWGVADGGNVISPLKEMIFYGILDVLAKPVFCFYHAYALRNIPYERFLLNSGKASTGFAAGTGAIAGAAGHEKGRMSTASNAPLTNDATTANTANTDGGVLNGRHGLTHRNSGRSIAEEGRVNA